MGKNEVYSWRITSARKTALDSEARREGTTVAGLLDRLTQEWIESRRGAAIGDAEQTRLHARVRQTVGTISGSDPRRAERAGTAIRNRVRRQHGR